MLYLSSKLLGRPARLSSRGDPLDRHEKPGYRARPRISHDSEFKQPGKDFRWNRIGVILQTEMFAARVGTPDVKPVDSVLKSVARQVIVTVRRENALNRISPGSRDVYEEPVVRYRNHPMRTSPDARRVARMIGVLASSRNKISCITGGGTSDVKRHPELSLPIASLTPITGTCRNAGRAGRPEVDGGPRASRSAITSDGAAREGAVGLTSRTGGEMAPPPAARWRRAAIAYESRPCFRHARRSDVCVRPSPVLALSKGRRLGRWRQRLLAAGQRERRLF
jgi:hypothetical protein